MNVPCAYDYSSVRAAGVNQMKSKSVGYYGSQHYIKTFGRGHQ